MLKIGMEYEFFSDYDAYDIEDHLEDLFGYNLASKFEVTTDPSLRRCARSKDMGGWEIITPPLSEKKNKEVFLAINEYLTNIHAVTNRSTGFHVNISIADSKRMLKLDPRVMISATDDYYIAKVFDRHKNKYCRTWKENVSILNSKIQSANKNSKTYKRYDLKHEFDNLVDTLYHDYGGSNPVIERSMNLVDAKYSSINISKIEPYGYVEYRMIGGPNYFRHETKILEAIEHFKLGQELAMDRRNTGLIDQYLDWASK